MKNKFKQTDIFLLMILVILLSGWVDRGLIFKEEAESPFPKGIDYVTLTDFEKDVKDNDWALALEKAFSMSDRVWVPQGKYICSRIKVPSGKSILGAGEQTVFIPKDEKLFIVEGSIGKEISIEKDISDFSNTICLNHQGKIKKGDNVLIRGQRNSMIREGIEGVNYNTAWVLGRTRKSSCFFGEMDVVKSVDKHMITTRQNRIFPAYHKDNSREPNPSIVGKGFLFRKATTISVMNMVENILLSNFSIEGNSKCWMPIKLSYCKNCIVDRISFYTSAESYKPSGDADLSLVYGLYAWNTCVREFKAILSPSLLKELDSKAKEYKNYSNYNLFKMVSCVNSGFEDCYSNGGTHSFNITRSASAKGRGGIPSVNCYIKNCVALNNIWSGVTVQQGCYNTELLGNTVLNGGQGIISGGRNTHIRNNKVETNLPYETNYYYTLISRGGTTGIGLIEGYACGSVVSDNEISGFYSGIQILDGYEDKNCFEEGNIIIERNKVTDCIRGFAIYKNPYNLLLGRKDLNVRVDNNTFKRDTPPTLLINEKQTDTYGIYLPQYTKGVKVTANSFENLIYGIWMDSFVDSLTFTDNRMKSLEVAFFLNQSSGNKLNYNPHIKKKNNYLQEVKIDSRRIN